MTKRRTIAINNTYRLSIDADNVQIESLNTVDPTKSPAFDPAKHSPDIRAEWKSIGKFFSTVPKALTYLQIHSLGDGEDATLLEILAEVKAFRAHIDGLLGVVE